MVNTTGDNVNKQASNPKKSKKILQALNIKPGDYVADIGAGKGYFAIEFARKVGKNGRIYAVEINQNSLNYIKERATTEGLTNITAILLNEETLTLPQKVDLIFCRYTCHHIKNKNLYFNKLKTFLKPNGRLAIIEYKKPKFLSFLVKLLNHFTKETTKHYISKEALLKQIKSSGYILLKDFDFLPKQNFLIFQPIQETVY